MSRFSTALSNGDVRDVPMNQIDYVSFTDGGIKAIGTSDLNGAAAVILVSKKGALLAHISPLPFPTEDPLAGKDHTMEQMRDFLQLWQNRDDFREDPWVKISAIVCGHFQGEVALPDQRDLIKTLLLENLEGFTPRMIRYDIQDPATRAPADGTVFIDGSGRVPKVYVNDKDQRWFR